MSSRYEFKNRALKRYLGDNPRVGTVVIDIDWEALVDHLGTKAAYNRSGKSKVAFGIKAKFIPKQGGQQ